MMNKILLEELKRIQYISNYNLEKTSVENSQVILERNSAREGSREFRTFLDSVRGTEVVRGELENILKTGGFEIKTAKTALSAERTLTKASEILKALKEGKLSEKSVAELKTAMFQNTKSSELINAISKDIVNSEKFVNEYSHLSNSEILNKLNRGPMKIPKNSDQARAVINAHEAKIAEEARAAGEARAGQEARAGEEGGRINPKDEPKPYKSEKEYKNTERMTEEERIIELKRRKPKKERIKMMKEDPKGFFDYLKKGGLLIWKGGGWVLSNLVWIAIFGGLAYGVWALWSRRTGVKKDCPEGMVYDSESGDCVRGGESESEDEEEENKIRDKEGNVYNPCEGIFKIGCVTQDGVKENGVDYISQAQDCLGLSPTGMFNKEMEEKLYKKINKRTFTKSDMTLICMRRSTLAAL